MSDARDEKTLDRLRAKCDSDYRSFDIETRLAARHTLIGDHWMLRMHIRRLWHEIGKILRPVIDWVARMIVVSR